MAKETIATCPCGFRLTTPHGVDEAVDVIQNHAVRIHPGDYPQRPSREDALKYIETRD